MAGATTVTSPSRNSSLRRARRPGANTPSSLVKRICIVGSLLHVSSLRLHSCHVTRGPALPIVTARADQRQPARCFQSASSYRLQVRMLPIPLVRHQLLKDNDARQNLGKFVRGGSIVMETETIGRVLTEATIENLKDLWDKERGLVSTRPRFEESRSPTLWLIRERRSSHCRHAYPAAWSQGTV